MKDSQQDLLASTLSVSNGYTPGTSLATHVSHKLSSLVLLEIERLIKGNSDLNLASWRALRGLSMIEGSSQKELIKFANFDQGQMSRALSDLEKKGYVKSERSKQDKRSWHFSITESGQLAHDQLSPIIDEFHQVLTDALTDAELETFVKLSEKVSTAVTKQYSTDK